MCWHWYKANWTILFRRWVLEEGLIADFGSTYFTYFFVLRPMILLTFSITILDLHARLACLETNAPLLLATLGAAGVDLVHPGHQPI